MSLKRFLASVLGMAMIGVTHAWAAPGLSTLVAPIRDYTSTVTVAQVNSDELVKISKNYATSYRIKTSRISFMAPDHFKVDGKLGPLGVVYVINGNTKSYKYGPLRRTENVADAPGKKQGLMEFGVLTAGQLNDYNWKFVQEDKSGGTPLYVYELRFKNFKEDPSRKLIWVDPAKHVLTRWRGYHQFHDNQLKMELRFEDMKPVGGGVWAPATIKVYNPEGKLGAVSKQGGVAVNKGLPMSTFKL